MPNPYRYGPLVKDPDTFFGREEDLDHLRERLRHMQSTSVVGLRRIGKSSLLFRLTQILPDALGSDFVPLYVDLQDARCRTVADFVKTIVTELQEKVGEKLSLRNVTDMLGFSETIDVLNRSGIHLVLCLDEFETFTQRPQEFNDDFFKALRALGQLEKLALVTASRMRLTELIRRSGVGSPLFNIMSNRELGLLESEAAQALRRIPFEREGITLSQEDEDLIEALGGRHPFYLQMACSHFFEALHQPQGRWADEVRERFYSDAELHFERLWEHLDIDQKAALKTLIEQMTLTSDTWRTLGRLERLGVVEETDGRWQVFSNAFATSIQRFDLTRIDLPPRQMTRLRQMLVKYFNEEELRTLCFDLVVDYDDLPGTGKTNKARELISYLERRDSITELLIICRELRPKAPWEDILVS